VVYASLKENVMSSAGSYGGSGGGGVGSVLFLTGNSGGPVAPDLTGNINIVGTGAITVVDTPGTHTLTIELTGSVATEYDADTGTAIPVLGILNINGASGVQTTASGNTVIIELIVPVAIADGGTNATSMTDTDGVIYYDGISLVTTTVGTANQVLTSNGAGNAPTFQNVPSTGVISITGDAGGALSGAVSITGGTSGAFYTGTGGNTLTTTFTKLVMSDSTPTTGFISIGGRSVLTSGNSSANGNIFAGPLSGNTTLSGTGNAGLGQTVLNSLTTGAHNVAVGTSSLVNLTTGTLNTAAGNQSLGFLVTGVENIALGWNSGISYTTSESSNIIIGNAGTAAESNVIRIGTDGAGAGQQNATFIAGIYGESVGGTNAAVFIDNTGKLGTVGGSGGGGVTSITGDTGGPISGVLTITGASTGASFDTTGTTITESFNFLALPDTNNPLTTGYISMGGATVLAQYGTLGRSNIFTGSFCGNAAITGIQNTGDGSSALLSLTSGGNNTAIGCQAAIGVNTGTDNTAVGFNALSSSTSGSFNIAIGSQAASNYTGAESHNIIIGTLGTAAESNTIRLGDFATQTKCYIAGAYGETVGGTNAALFMDNTGKIGTVGGSGGGGVTTITGDTGGAITGALTITGGTSGASFDTAGTTITESFNYLNMPFTNAGGTVGVIQFAGNPIMGFYGGVGQQNVFLGDNAGNTGVSGVSSTGIGSDALRRLTSGSTNTSLGAGSLQGCTTAANNVALGGSALSALTAGQGGNVAVGTAALDNLDTGRRNIAIGTIAGNTYTTTESDNILIGNTGVVGDANTMRIGTTGSGTAQQNATFIAGIAGTTIANTAAVLISTVTEQLGTVISSRRYKENIHDLDSHDSQKLYNLRPVEFTYKYDEAKQKQFGLIAEEVEEVVPYLVAYNKEGAPETVRYHELPTLLLKEIQRLKLKIDELEGKINSRVR
jgi:trimeric autotransporter adhesin